MLTVGTWNLENLFRPGGPFGPKDKSVYDAKLEALAATITAAAPDVLGVQEVGDPAALADLVSALPGTWHTAVSSRFDADHPIRVAVLSRHPLQTVVDDAAVRAPMQPIQIDDNPQHDSAEMGRGVLGVDVDLGGPTVRMLVCHLKSKLLSFPGGRFFARDEGERARYGAYALYRRAAEAASTRRLVDDFFQENLLLVGDLNDQPQAATTQILYGPPGSQIGTAGFTRPDQGDAVRLFNLAPKIPEAERFTRIFEGQPELIDHVLVSHALVGKVREVHTVQDRRLPSITGDPTERRKAPDSDHAPIFATIDL